MAFRFIEKARTRETTSRDPTTTIKYVASGETDAAGVKNYAISATSPVIATTEGVLLRQDIRLQQVGYDIYNVDVTYSGRSSREAAGQPALGDYAIEFDTTGGTEHRKQSYETVAAFGTNANATQHNQAVGVDGDTIEGYDVVVPSLRLVIRYKHPMGQLSLSRINAISFATGKVNDSDWLGYPKRCALFIGASGAAGTDIETTVSYQFSIRFPETGLSVGSVTGIQRQGHDLLWVEYEDAVANDRASKEAKFVYQERIYEEADFAATLGIS